MTSTISLAWPKTQGHNAKAIALWVSHLDLHPQSVSIFHQPMHAPKVIDAANTGGRSEEVPWAKSKRGKSGGEQVSVLREHSPRLGFSEWQ